MEKSDYFIITISIEKLSGHQDSQPRGESESKH